MANIAPFIVGERNSHKHYLNQLTGIRRPGALSIEEDRCLVRLHSDEGHWQFPNCFTPSTCGEILLRYIRFNAYEVACDSNGTEILPHHNSGTHPAYLLPSFYLVSAMYPPWNWRGDENGANREWPEDPGDDGLRVKIVE